MDENDCFGVKRRKFCGNNKQKTPHTQVFVGENSCCCGVLFFIKVSGKGGSEVQKLDVFLDGIGDFRLSWYAFRGWMCKYNKRVENVMMCSYVRLSF